MVMYPRKNSMQRVELLKAECGKTNGAHRLSKIWCHIWWSLCSCRNSIIYSSFSFLEFDKRRSEEHTSELQSRLHLVCRLLLEKKKELKAMKFILPASAVGGRGAGVLDVA